MKTEFDKEFERLMTEKKEIPPHVRKRLDSTYDMIQTRPKKKKKKTAWMRISAAACTFLLAGGLLANEQVRAGISDFFSFQDKGIDKALMEGFAEVNGSSVTNQDVIVTLTQNFSDANKMGLSFELFFIDPTVLNEDITNVSMYYRLKNGDGEYIDESLPDTKSFKRKKLYTSGSETHFDIDLEKGVIQYDYIANSNKGILPTLKDAVIEIEAINFFQEKTKTLQIIEGSWDLPLKNQSDQSQLVEYVSSDANSSIELVSAIASPTSLNMQLIVDSEPFGPEGQFTWIVDEAGVEYAAQGYHLKEDSGKTTVDVNFPISAYHNAENLRLVIENIGVIELRKE